MRKYEKLNKYIGICRSIILQESNGEMNISLSSNGGFHLFLNEVTGFTYGFGLKALMNAALDFEYLQDKTRAQREEFVLSVENTRLKEELKFKHINKK